MTAHFNLLSMQKINLLYVITKLELGGAQKQLLSLIENLDQGRFVPFLLTAQDGLLVQEASAIRGLKLIKSRFLERPINLLNDLAVLFEIVRIIKKNNIHIVHTHSSKAGILGRWAAKLAKTKIIVHTVHGWSFNDYQPALRRNFFLWLERITALFTNKLIVVCYCDKQRGLANRIGAEDKYIIIRYGINHEKFKKIPQNLKQELGIAASDLVVTMVSCLKEQKWPAGFINLALKVIRTSLGIKFVLVGDGVLRKQLEKIIVKFNLKGRVFLTGWRLDIPRILSETDIFVLTSLWDGLPISVLEAMAASCPVVVTNTGGIREVVVEGKTGLMTSPGDLNGMARKLEVLIKDVNLRKQMGEQARIHLTGKYCLENMVRENQELYEELIKGAGYVN